MSNLSPFLAKLVPLVHHNLGGDRWEAIDAVLGVLLAYVNDDRDPEEVLTLMLYELGFLEIDQSEEIRQLMRDTRRTVS